MTEIAIKDGSYSRTAMIRSLAKTEPETALQELKGFIEDAMRIDVTNLEINYDQYSLNSLNGFFTSDGEPYFFKFHQEDGEEDMKGEYYRAELLAQADLPVDMPVWKSTMPGEQILVYRRRDDMRFSDLLRDLDQNPDQSKIKIAGLAERSLNAKILKVARATLHHVSPEEVAEEPFHHLFHERLINPKSGESPGGRYADFYVGQQFNFKNFSLSWDEFSTARLVLNGQEMKDTFGDIFSNAVYRLNPQNLCSAGGITAHGDAHNANVWYVEEEDIASLILFDPAFAGRHIPSLMAEVKATFHNVFAHPYWLYDAKLACEQFSADVTYIDGALSIETDWKLSAVREELLSAKIQSFWKPFLLNLKEREMLPMNWRDTIRSSFAMCPTLVMNLRANADRHNETSSAIGFYVAALAGSEPVQGRNIFTDFFDQIDPHLGV